MAEKRDTLGRVWAKVIVEGNELEEIALGDDLLGFDPDDPHELGRAGEEIAARYLLKHGYDVLARNWRCRFGEVDIIAVDPLDEESAVLVEVKTRRNGEALPELAVDDRKVERYHKLGLAYLQANERLDAIRFDVIAVNIPAWESVQLHHIRCAAAWDL